MADKSQLGQKKCRLETEADRKRTAVSLGDMNEESAHKLVETLAIQLKNVSINSAFK